MSLKWPRYECKLKDDGSCSDSIRCLNHAQSLLVFTPYELTKESVDLILKCKKCAMEALNKEAENGYFFFWCADYII